jgi:hypothetical protein
MMQQGHDVGHSQLPIFRERNVSDVRTLVVNFVFIFLDC